MNDFAKALSFSSPTRTTSKQYSLLCVVLLSFIAPACQRGPSEPPPGSRPSAPTTATTPGTNPHGGTTTGTAMPMDPHAGLGIPAPSGTNAPPLAMPGTPGTQGTTGTNPAANSQPNAAALAWDDPPGWRREQPSSPMRQAQYKIPKVGADAQDAELTVITFGAGQGGGIDANVQRWLGQVEQTDGRPTSEVAQRRSLTTHGMNVTIVEAPGRLRSSMPMAMPTAGAVPPSVIERGRLLAAIVEAPSGMWFFKMTGGDETVSGARAAFDQLLRSLH